MVKYTDRLHRRITLAFALLAVALTALILGYWRFGLQPGLRREAQYQADLMAQAQADRLAEQILEVEAGDTPQSIRSILDEILSFTEKISGRPFFSRIVVELDVSVVDLDPVIWDLGGDTHTPCEDYFVSEISLFHPHDYRLMGIARFWVTSRFYREHLSEFHQHLLLQGLITASLLVIAWALVLALVTQVERQRAELNAAKERAEQANRAKSALLANVSHELRTPMSSIIGLARLMVKNPCTARTRDQAEKILEAAETLLIILDDILDLSKMEAGRVVLEDEDFLLDEVLNRLGSLVALRAEASALELDIAIAPGVPRSLRGDPVRLGQVLLNLTSNAIKFTPAGRVRVGVELLACTAQTATLRFAVEDTGIGIAAQDLDKLFQPFTQLDASNQRHHGGAGLGLAISRHLVERMGGVIRCDSQPGQGSVFQFELCLARTQPANALMPAPPPSADEPLFLPGTRVLVAEDHAVNRDIAVEVLTGLGLEVEAVADGEAALRRLARGDMAAVLMDVRMPGLDGLEATRRLRADPRLGDLPVIALTAHAMIGDAERFRAQGMTDVLSKPLDEQDLLRVLRRCLPLPAHQGGSASTFAALAQHYAQAKSEASAANARGQPADAIAIMQRFRVAAVDAKAPAVAETALALQRAMAKGDCVDELWQILDTGLQTLNKPS